MFDVAPRLTDARLLRLYSDARRAHHLHNDDLRELLQRVPSARVTHLITDDNPTASDLEDAFLSFVDGHGLPRPKPGLMIAGYEVDFCYPEQRLIIELDSWTFHRDRASLQNDRARDSATTAAGWRTVRVTAERLTDAEAVRLAAILGV